MGSALAGQRAIFPIWPIESYAARGDLPHRLEHVALVR
jgi:hypothetical protein